MTVFFESNRLWGRFIFSKPVTCSPSNQSLTAGQTLKAFRKYVYFLLIAKVFAYLPLKASPVWIVSRSPIHHPKSLWGVRTYAPLRLAGLGRRRMMKCFAFLLVTWLVFLLTIFLKIRWLNWKVHRFFLTVRPPTWQTVFYKISCAMYPPINKIKPPVRLEKAHRALVRHSGFWIFFMRYPLPVSGQSSC